MSIRLYNSLSGEKEVFEPIEPGVVKMYSCGPTVYNYFHIGNARAFVVFDMVRRYLRYRGFKVKFVQNFTDVDDKLIKRANELDTTVNQVASQYIDAYFADASALGIEQADVHPRVTETMDDIIAFISGLIDAGYAYVADGDVLFDTPKFKDYGQLSKQSLDELQAGSRVEVSDLKRNAIDFTLWKAAKPGEPWWDSPWGHGRPGWHIECSAMIQKHLGEHIDIHGGGHDLLFPHHENEIAQSEALLGAPLARYFLHNGYININNEKMSKSLGNSIFVHDLVKRYDSRALRMFLLSAQYRSPINYSDDVMAQMVAAIRRMDSCYDSIVAKLETPFLPEGETFDASPWEDRLIEAMDDDINTGDAIGVMFDFIRMVNSYLHQGDVDRAGLQGRYEKLKNWLQLFGLEKIASELPDEEIAQMIESRAQARFARNFAKADAIREKLLEQGIHLEDTAQGVRWWRE
ncbi:MAG: cysteine--tRNA ligase [Acidibacillus sp.]|uniref:Cysteine--tRNA ligase n=1 Tax=Sulfoacidibacillus ferrooxidans TaxID=2005001 RepID=A0A9X2AEY5_9BACL|nr:cysteine--tRNA ligase [Sulfoacidibacillus ferrooxidans]MCI0183867.1 Cysteine--tRNA ligase [Sulfoacidibacillus ferrooxidans]MCY0893728.1 cysteine--tRNA ligase [Acidibacillus sp.]